MTSVPIYSTTVSTKPNAHTIVLMSTKVGSFVCKWRLQADWLFSGYSCRCPLGYTLQNDYRTCKEDAHVHEVEEEKDYDDNEAEEHVPIVECSSEDHEVCSPGNCVVVGSEKECSCPSGFAAKSRNCVDINECEYGSHQCSHSCHNTEGSYSCSCPHGLRLSEDEQTCDDFDECSQDDICGSMECRNTYGSYKCICQDGEEIDEHGRCRAVNLCENNNGGCSQCVPKRHHIYY